MKSTELRIGNYFDNNGNADIINPNQIEALFESENREWIKPIPLTEEKLIECGAEHDRISGENVYSLEITENLTFVYSDGDYYLSDSKGFEVISFGSEYYMHQLQNLYFALTNKELTI